ncbi:DUF6090 family protein [uncultured Algibacter sp.]|uniref:DUF6090 family protein n=1 Tax=uncultured Algibacter sp. TaxID=298659 RepID=UPI002613645F|nr:DUF6090 family protein [uncultured Algibacter sp.]
MIKFFRIIRKQLLSEGKTSKYLKYAIGEIVLVVIGILLALQINNWNENRKKQKLKDVYINALVHDLKQDTLDLGLSIRRMKSDLKVLKQFNLRISKKNATIDTLKHIARFEYSPYFYPDNSVNNNTYTTLTSTGNMDLLDPWLSDALLVLNNNQEQSIKIIDVNINLHLSALANYIQKYNPIKGKPFLMGTDLFESYGPLDDYIWDNANDIDLISEFTGILTSKGSMEQIIIWRRENLLKETSKLLDTINAVYKTKE